jgi:hypothetical protein
LNNGGLKLTTSLLVGLKFIDSPQAASGGNGMLAELPMVEIPKHLEHANKNKNVKLRIAITIPSQEKERGMCFQSPHK